MIILVHCMYLFLRYLLLYLLFVCYSTVVSAHTNITLLSKGDHCCDCCRFTLEREKKIIKYIKNKKCLSFCCFNCSSFRSLMCCPSFVIFSNMLFLCFYFFYFLFASNLNIFSATTSMLLESPGVCAEG